MKEAEALDAADEIDWTQDPRNDPDAVLRREIIRRVVAENRAVMEHGNEAIWKLKRSPGQLAPTDIQLAQGTALVAPIVARRLESHVIDQVILNDGDYYYGDYAIGSDLREEIEHWEGIEKENDHRARRLERQRLVREAKLDTAPAFGVS